MVRAGEQVEYWAMTREEFISRHRGRFYRSKGGRNIVGVMSDNEITMWGLPTGSQRAGRLTRSADDILGDIHENIVGGAVSQMRGSASPYAPPMQKVWLERCLPDEVVKDYPMYREYGCRRARK